MRVLCGWLPSVRAWQRGDGKGKDAEHARAPRSRRQPAARAPLRLGTRLNTQLESSTSGRKRAGSAHVHVVAVVCDQAGDRALVDVACPARVDAHARAPGAGALERAARRGRVGALLEERQAAGAAEDVEDQQLLGVIT